MSIPTPFNPLGTLGATAEPLPPGYKRVLCLVSSGAQAINTGWVPNALTDELELDAVYISGNGANGVTYVLSYIRVSREGSSIYIQDGSKKYSTGDNGLERFTAIMGPTRIELRRSGQAVYSALKEASAVDILNRTFRLFASHGISGKTSDYSTEKVYRATVRRNGDVLHDFVPCLDANGKPCMYDLVGDTTHYNYETGNDFEWEIL